MESAHLLRTLTAFALTLALAACGSEGGTDPGDDDPIDPPDGLLRGVALSPDGFPDDFSQVEAFFQEVGGWDRSTVMWNGPWRDDLVDGTDAGTVPAAAQLVANGSQEGQRFTPVFVFGWRSEEQLFIRVPTNPVNDWRNLDAREIFAQMLADFATARTPSHIFLGNESDFYVEQDPVDYARWIDAYDEAYDAIKAVSPGTRVGPVFNVEHMLGRGAFSGWNEPFTEAFTLHDPERVDVVGLTVYPYLGTADPADVPADYLDGIFDLIGERPIAITETGWPAGAPGGPVPWAPGTAEQVTWLERLEAMLDGRDVDFVQWLFLHPLASGSPDVLSTFGTVSLRDNAGATRPVYDPFVAFGAEDGG